MKPGNCPAVTDVDDTLVGKPPCGKYDTDCSGRSKCCKASDGTGYCVPPYNGQLTCSYEGQRYTRGQVMHKNACTSCTCVKPSAYHSDKKSEFDCHVRKCPQISCSRELVMQPGSCCQVCPHDDGTLDEGIDQPEV